jgi:hypothetical protein
MTTIKKGLCQFCRNTFDVMRIYWAEKNHWFCWSCISNLFIEMQEYLSPIEMRHIHEKFIGDRSVL